MGNTTVDNIRETSEETTSLDRAGKLLGKMLNSNTGDTLFYLWDRWQDEREYEDFSEYVTRAKKAIETNSTGILQNAGIPNRGFTFVKMTKGFTITMKYQPNILVTVKAKVERNKRAVTWVGKLQLV